MQQFNVHELSEDVCGWLQLFTIYDFKGPTCWPTVPLGLRISAYDSNAQGM